MASLILTARHEMAALKVMFWRRSNVDFIYKHSDDQVLFIPFLCIFGSVSWKHLYTRENQWSTPTSKPSASGLSWIHMSQDLTLGINTTEGECERGSLMVLRVAISRLKSILRWWWWGVGREGGCVGGGGRVRGVFTGSSLRWFLSVVIQRVLYWSVLEWGIWKGLERGCLSVYGKEHHKQTTSSHSNF